MPVRLNHLPRGLHRNFLARKEDVGRSHRTLNAYSRTLEEFFHEEFPDITPADVEVGHIEEYIETLSNRDLAQNTKRRYLESLSAFHDLAMKRPRFHDITGNPAVVVLEELPQVVHDRSDCATWTNGKTIVHHIGDPRRKTVCILLAKTGARVTEVLSLEMDDLRLDDGHIRFWNRKSNRTTVFPLDEETTKALERYQFVRNGRGTHYLFTGVRGDRLSREQVRRTVRAAAVDADIMREGESWFAKKFTPHVPDRVHHGDAEPGVSKESQIPTVLRKNLILDMRPRHSDSVPMLAPVIPMAVPQHQPRPTSECTATQHCTSLIHQYTATEIEVLGHPRDA